MKCELCQSRPAQTALVTRRDGEEVELYVCRECARAEKSRRQKKSQRTRKVTGLPPGVSMSVTQIGGGDGETPPPIVSAILNAFQDMVSDIEKAKGETDAKKEPVFHDFPCDRCDARYRIGARLHLEGLHLIGELDAVKRAVEALKMQLVGLEADGVHDAGHAYRIRYTGSTERARRVVEDILAQERNARVRLFEEMTRHFGDALCRALAILKNCRMLSGGELYDLLSPMRLAAMEKMLDGITLKEVNGLLAELAGELDAAGAADADADDAEEKTAEALDAEDAERADAMNKRFEDVVLNERAEGKFL